MGNVGLDLVTEPEWPNPFASEFPVNYWVEFNQLLMAYGEQLKKPLRAPDDVADYIPSQKLAERIETAGADGIRYPSAMEPVGPTLYCSTPRWLKSVDRITLSALRGGHGS
jgi:hypothetical protein